MNITEQYGIPIFQIDRNIISIGSSVFSEYPIYYFEFDNDNNLILYPVIGDYDNIEPIKYTLKRQNYVVNPKSWTQLRRFTTLSYGLF